MERLTNEEQEQLQRVIAQLNNHQASVEPLRQHISMLTTSLTELSMTIGTIKSLKELEQGTGILVPVGSDSFINAKIAQPDKVLTGLGADVVAERTSDDTVKVLEARSEELGKAMEQARNELERLEERIETLRPEAEKLLRKARDEPERQGATLDV